MKRYMVEKEAIALLGIETDRAVDKLGEDIIITNEAIHFDSIPYGSVILTDEQLAFLRSRGFDPTPEVTTNNALLGADYERLRSFHFKKLRKGVTGRGVKVAVLDTGCNDMATFGIEVVHCDFGVNFVTGDPGCVDGHGHGTRVCSSVKHPVIGNATDCILHAVKIISDAGFMTEASTVAGFDYCIQQEIDFINLSWTFWTPNIQAAIEACIAAGIVVCAASGNTGGTEDTYTLLPASLPGVVAVNAVQENGNFIYRNVIPNTLPGCHGVNVACAGYASEGYNRAGGYGGGFGTSFSCPVFVGLLASFKEELGESDNNKVLSYALSKARKTTQPTYFGVGIASY